ncbi:MAG: argininosuccinate lyase [Coriobacteriia bacterium]
MSGGKAWGGRFEGELDAFIEEFGASLPFDRRLWEEDIRGSAAHARMLAAQGIISEEDAAAIQDGLARIYREIAEGRFDFDPADEDIHMAIERRLIDLVGPAGGRLHTARSRNDQVALDERMWAMRAAARMVGALNDLRLVLLRLAEDHSDAVMPGYTHMQKAQPILFAHHALAYFWMFTRDAVRFRRACDSADDMPLGSGALAGTGLPIDRREVASALGFSRVTANSMDAVSDRDFLLDLVYACSVCMMHLSRLCEELVLWNTEEFGFISMDDAYATGSSMMPQKKNPDVAELVRGKTGRVVGDLVSLMVTLKSLPLAYNKDMQEDKPAAFDAVDTLADSLRAVSGMLDSLHINEEKMAAAARGGFMAATDLADYLVERGVPFRKAHEVVGRIVLDCEKAGRDLSDLGLDELRGYSDAFEEGALRAVDIAEVVGRRNSEGGTGHAAVAAQLERAQETLADDMAWADSHLVE